MIHATALVIMLTPNMSFWRNEPVSPSIAVSRRRGVVTESFICVGCFDQCFHQFINCRIRHLRSPKQPSAPRQTERAMR